MNKKYIIASIIGLIVLLGGLNYYKNNSENKDIIKIGGISALTGVGVAIGEEEGKGALLAVNEINENGGIDGKRLELISEDVSIDKIKIAVSVAKKLIEIDNVVAIVGPQWDEPAFPILPIIEDTKTVVVGADSSPMLEVDKEYTYFFSTWYDNRVGIRELLRFAQKRNLKRVAIIKPIAAGFWEYTAREFVKEAPNFGVEIIDEVDMGNPLELDFKTSLLKIMHNNPEAIFIVTSDYNQCTFLKQAAQIGYKGITLGTESSGDPTSLSQCPDLLEKRYFSTTIQSDAYKAFAERFKKRFGQYPKFPSAATAYDAVQVIAAGLRKTDGKGGEGLRQALVDMKDLKGVSLENLSFNSMGFVDTPENTYEIKTVKDGKFIKAE